MNLKLIHKTNTIYFIADRTDGVARNTAYHCSKKSNKYSSAMTRDTLNETRQKAKKAFLSEVERQYDEINF